MDKKRTRPNHAVQFTVWSVNGGPLDEAAVQAIEASIEETIFSLFNDGHRLLTQTNQG